jgi:histone H3/H4
MAFDPNAYLAATPAPAAGFNPDAYLAQPNVSEIPKGRKAATMTEQALATPVARTVLGAATPFVGAVQFGANLGDYFNEKLGQKPVVSKAISDWWNEIQAMKERGMEATMPEAALGAKSRDIIGTAAGILPALAQPSTAVTKGQQILEGLKQGAIAGAMQPGTERLSDQAIGGATGAVLGGVAPVALPAIAKAAGWIWDAVGGRLIQVKAGKILREISGDNLSAIQTANANAAPGLTSAQAVQEAGVITPVYQAMNQRAPTANIAAAKANKEAADAAARAARIESVTPDIEAARIAREAAAGPLYEQARKAAAKVSPELQTVFERLPKGTLEKAADLARMDGRSFIIGETKPAQLVPTGLLDAAGQPITKTAPATTATISGESLHYIKRALSDIANASPATGMGKDTQAVARNVLTDYLKVVESKNVLPIYGQARQTFAQESAPVNQAQILNKMLETLKGSGTAGEKPAQFLNALGQGESALLKRADQNPRFGGINEVLTPPQMGAVNKVAGELKREADMAALAQQGKEALAAILKERPITVPGINTVSAVVNRVASVLRGRVSEKTLETISKGMQTGKGANELLATLPSAEREAVLMALGEMKVSGATAGIVGGNALTPNRKNQNALAK